MLLKCYALVWFDFRGYRLQMYVGMTGIWGVVPGTGGTCGHTYRSSLHCTISRRCGNRGSIPVGCYFRRVLACCCWGWFENHRISVGMSERSLSGSTSYVGRLGILTRGWAWMLGPCGSVYHRRSSPPPCFSCVLCFLCK